MGNREDAHQTSNGRIPLFLRRTVGYPQTFCCLDHQPAELPRQRRVLRHPPLNLSHQPGDYCRQHQHVHYGIMKASP